MEVMLFVLYQPGQASLPLINQAEPVFAEAGAVVKFLNQGLYLQVQSEL